MNPNSLYQPPEIQKPMDVVAPDAPYGVDKTPTFDQLEQMKKIRLKRITYLFLAIAGLLLLIIVAIIYTFFIRNKNSDNQNNAQTKYVTTDAQIKVSNDTSANNLGQISKIDVNGTLNIKGTLILPNNNQEPINPQPGQLYYDTTGKSINFYNGSDFASLATQADVIAAVNSLTSNLEVNSSTSSTTTTTSNVTVKSGGPQLTVTNDGNGNYTIGQVGGFVSLAQGSAQTDNSANSLVFLNKTGASGNILQLQKSGSDVLALGNNGSLLLRNSSDSATALQVQNANGDNIINVDTNQQAITLTLAQNGPLISQLQVDNNMSPSGVLATADGGRIQLGSTQYNGDNGAMVAKFNSTGAMQWSKFIPGLAYSFNTYGSAQLADGSYIIVGYTDNSGNGNSWDAAIIKLGSDGNIIWTKTWGGNDFDSMVDVKSINDGGFVTVGQANSYNDDQGDVLITRYDSDGNIIWTKTWGIAGSFETASALAIGEDNNLVVSSYNGSSGILLKYSPTGDLLWSQAINISGYDSNDIYGVVARGDTYAVTGNAYLGDTYKAYIMTFDSDGNVIQTKLYSNTTRPNDSTVSYSIVPTSDGAYIMSGYGYDGNSVSYGLATKIDADGDVLWSRSYAGVSSFYAFTENSNHNYIGIGDTFNPSGTVTTAIYDADGNIQGCLNVCSDVAMDATDAAIDIGDTSSAVDFNPSVTDYTLLVDSVDIPSTINVVTADSRLVVNGSTYIADHLVVNDTISTSKIVVVNSDTNALSVKGLDGSNLFNVDTQNNQVTLTAATPGVYAWGNQTNVSVLSTTTLSSGATVMLFNYGDMTGTYGIAKFTGRQLDWAKDFATGYRVRAVTSTTDGGYIITGVIYPAFSPKMVVIKFDVNDDIEFINTYDHLGGNHPNRSAYNIRQTDDGGYIIAGMTGEETTLLFKIDTDGVEEWSAKTDVSGAVFTSVRQASDGSYIAAGHSYGNDTGILARFDSSGNLDWMQEITDASMIWSVVELNNGQLRITGVNKNSGIFFVAAYDDSGDQLWVKELPASVSYPSAQIGGFNGSPDNMVATPDGGYALSAYSANSHQALLIKFNAQDAVSWVQGWGVSDSSTDNNPVLVSLMPDNSYLTLAGVTYGFDGSSQALFANTYSASGVSIESCDSSVCHQTTLNVTSASLLSSDILSPTVSSSSFTPATISDHDIFTDITDYEPLQLAKAGFNINASSALNGNLTVRTDNRQAFQIQAGDGTNLFKVDTVNKKLLVVGTFDINNIFGMNLFKVDTDSGITTVDNLAVTNGANFTGVVTINGHIVTGNQTGSTTIAAGAAACTTPIVSVEGNDTAGKVIISTGTGCSDVGYMAEITFAHSYSSPPVVTLTAATASAANLKYYTIGDPGSFSLATDTIPTDSTTYAYYYHILQ